MANTTIPNLPVAITLDGTEQVEIVQPPGNAAGVSKRTTTGAIASLGGGGGGGGSLLAAQSIFGNPNPTSSVGTSIVASPGAVLRADDGGVPGFGPINLGTSSAVTSILPVSFGGSGASALTANGVVLGNGTAPLSAVAPVTAGYVLTSTGTGSAPTYQLGGGLAFEPGLSVLGVTGTATAQPAAIVGTQDQVVRVDANGTALTFGQVNLSASAAVTGYLNVSTYATGVLQVPHGGLGTSILNAFGVLFGNATAAVVAGTAFLAGQVLLGQSATAYPVPTTLIGDIGSITAGGTATIATAAISYNKFQQVAGLSVTGVTGTATAVMAAITGTANEVLRIDPAGNVLGFGQINLSSTAAITGQLSISSFLTGVVTVPFGGTGTSALTAFGVVLGNGTSAVTVATAGASGQLLIGQTTTSQPKFLNVTGDLTLAAAGTATIATAVVTYVKIQNVGALSVFGNASTVATVGADINGTANQVLIINPAGTALDFGQVNLSATAAITGFLNVASYATGVLGVPNGGIGTSALTSNAVLVGNGTSAVSFVANATSGYILTSTGTTTAPTYQAPGGLSPITGLSVLGVTGTATATPIAITGVTDQVLRVDANGTALTFGQINLSSTSAVTGALATSYLNGVISVPFGGTGTSGLTANSVVVANGTSAFTVVSNVTSGYVLTSNGTGAVPTFQNAGGGLAPIGGLSVLANSSTASQVPAGVAGTTDQVFRVASSGTTLGFGAINLGTSAAVSGVLAVPNGGSGTSSLAAFTVLVGNGTAAVGVVGPLSAGQLLIGQTTTSDPAPTTVSGDFTLSAAGTATIANGVVTYAKLQQIAALSVIGNGSSASATAVAITGTANEVLLVNAAGTGLAFGLLSASASLTGIIPVLNGGTGTSALTAFGVVLGNGTAAVTIATAGTAGQILVGQTSTSQPIFRAVVGDISFTAGGTASINTGAVQYSDIQNVGALSVFGNTSSAATVGGDINGTANQVLIINPAGTALDFGQVNLSATAAVTGILPVVQGGTGASVAATAIVNLGGLSLTTTAQAFSGGVVLTQFNLGTAAASTLTLVAGNPGVQYVVINGTAAFVAPSSNCEIDIMVKNATSAGSITFSGFSVGSNTGDAYTTTNNSRFLLMSRTINGSSTYAWKALQ